MQSITILQPDDMHVHFRDGDVLADVVKHTAQQFGKCIVMPNLAIPITTTDLALEYYARLKPYCKNLKAYLTLYLTDNTPIEEVDRAVNSSIIKGFKLYPAGATTLSHHGVTDIKKCYKVLERMQELGLNLLVHGEVTTHDIDIFDREKRFIDDVLIKLKKDFPQLKISFEHITTSQAVDYVLSDDSGYLAATITPQHLLYNRNDMLVGAIKPHYYCLPILKRFTHQKRLLQAASSGDNRFFAGTDSAPHSQNAKENACGCAGCYSALHAIELYATAFDNMQALDKLEGFMSIFGSQFYNLPLNKNTITIQKKSWLVPNKLNFGAGTLIPLAAGQELAWKLL